MRRVAALAPLAVSCFAASATPIYQQATGITINVCSTAGTCPQGAITIQITPGTATPVTGAPIVMVGTGTGTLPPVVVPPVVTTPPVPLGTNTALTGLTLYPSSPTLYTDVSALPVSPRNARYQCYAGISSTSGCPGLNFGFKFDFSGLQYETVPYGIPYNVFWHCAYTIPSTSNVNAGSSNISESDDIPFPDFGCAGAVEENGTDPRTNWTGAPGDHHWTGLDVGKMVEISSYQLLTVNGQLTSDSTAIWDITKPFEQQRAIGRTSADAAGYPILPFEIRPDEVLGTGTSAAPNGTGITHTMRGTLDGFSSIYGSQGCLDASATHNVDGHGSGVPTVCLGMHLRLQASFTPTYTSPVCNILLAGLKKYGMVYADVGNRNYISGVGDPRYSDDDLISCASQLHGGNFDLVDVTPNQPLFTAILNDGATTSQSVKKTDINTSVALSPPPPSALSLTASATSAAIGATVTLTGTATNAGSGLMWTDCAGPMINGVQAVTISKSLSCTLYVQNANGISRTASPLTITAH